jgi:diadenosine tetraphosphatase ApaH/serine/threonine PP2A family protein phosphatase
MVLIGNHLLGLLQKQIAAYLDEKHSDHWRRPNPGRDLPVSRGPRGAGGGGAKMMRVVSRSAAAIICLTLSGAAHAALLGRALDPLHGNIYRAVYDTDLNITWLVDEFGPSDWGDAQAFVNAANELEFFGVNNWRLPLTVQPDPTCDVQRQYLSGFVEGFGFNCKGSEFGHLYYSELGGVAGVASQPFPFFGNLANAYWSQPQGGGPTQRILFTFSRGAQIPYNVGSGFTEYNVLLVAPGDPLAVPVPTAVWFFGSALGVMGALRRNVTENRV